MDFPHLTPSDGVKGGSCSVRSCQKQRELFPKACGCQELIPLLGVISSGQSAAEKCRGLEAAGGSLQMVH